MSSYVLKSFEIFGFGLKKSTNQQIVLFIWSVVFLLVGLRYGLRYLESFCEKVLQGSIRINESTGKLLKILFLVVALENVKNI